MEYIELKQNATHSPYIPSVAMEFDGFYLENKIEGYSTLNVYGREMHSYDIDSQRREDADGAIRYGKSLPPRVLTIEYMLDSDSSEEQQEKFDLLRYYLSSNGPVPIRFKDQPRFTFYGEFQGAEEVESNKLNIVSRFTVICYDPRKYGNTIVTDGKITILTRYTTYPDKIEVKTSTEVSKLDIKAPTKTISLVGSIPSGALIEIDVQKGEIKMNGATRYDLVSLTSDFENFTVETGDVITTTNGTIKVYQREVLG